MCKDERTKLWEQRVNDFLKSGLSAQVWCKANGVGMTRLYAWKKRLSNPVESEVPASLAQTKPAWFQLVPADSTAVKPDTAADSNANSRSNIPGLQIKIREMAIEVQQGFDPALLTQVIGVLRSC